MLLQRKPSARTQATGLCWSWQSQRIGYSSRWTRTSRSSFTRAESSHAGLIRLPDVRVARRIEMIEELIDQHSGALQDRAIVTIEGGRVRVSRSPRS